MPSLASVQVERTAFDRAYQSITVTPMTPVVGAEIGNIDLSQPLSEIQLQEVTQAFTDHAVLVFRDQKLTRDDHKRFGRYFGRLHTHPTAMAGADTDGIEGDPKQDHEILTVMSNRHSKIVAGEEWHSDVTCDEEPPLGSMLYITETPEIGCGGDTCFMSAYEAYEALSPAVKEMLEGLDALHDGGKAYAQGYGLGTPPGGWPQAVHPVIPTHPESGRKYLFVNRSFTAAIQGMGKLESDCILEMLWRHIESNPIFQCRVRWEPNTLTFWDNRAVQHHAVWDYFPFSRYGERVAIVGGRPSR